jgi:hypothetical protein
MRDECILCDAAVIRPASLPHDAPLLCAICRSNLQKKVDDAVVAFEHDMVASLDQKPAPAVPGVPLRYAIPLFALAVLLGTLCYWWMQ